MRKFLIFFLSALFLVSCEKRYEDGPCLSFIKPENRIAGRWKIDAFFIDGTEQTAVQNNDSLANCTFTFFRNSDNAMYASLLSSSDRVWAESLVRTDERMIYLTYGLTAITGYESEVLPVFHALPALSAEQTWKITRLKRKEMRLKTEYLGAEHELWFKLVMDYGNM